MEGQKMITSEIPSRKSKRKALILCLFFGLLGIHDFYLGKSLEGVVKFLTLNLFAIGWLIDLTRIANNDYTDYAGLPVTEG